MEQFTAGECPNPIFYGSDCPVIFYDELEELDVATFENIKKAINRIENGEFVKLEDL